MKIVRLGALSILTTIFLAAGMALEAQNLLRNGGFDSLREEEPRAWETHTFAGSAEFSVDSEGRTGSAVKISSASGSDAAWTQSVEVPAMTRLRLSGWIRTENVAQGPGNGRGALLNIHTFEGAETRALRGTRDWTRVEVEFTSLNRQEIQINALFGGWGQATGTAWFDDLSLEVIGNIDPGGETLQTAVSIASEPAAHHISEYIYGQFIEHLGECIYGGIWAEMLQDRKFYYPVPAGRSIWRTTGAGARVLAASPWQVIGPRDNVRMTTDNAYSGDHSPLIDLTGEPGGIFQDELGVLSGKDYTGHIVLRGSASAAPVEISLVWGDGRNDRHTVVVDRLHTTHVTSPLRFTAGADTHEARLEIVALGGQGELVVDVVSLMPADNIEGFRRDTLEALRELNSPIYRWPGGNFVSGYDWRDGLGERDRRPTRSNPAWTGIEPNDMGMHEFVRLCQLIDAEPMITVNTGFGDAYSAAAQLEYANGDRRSEQGRLRAMNGSPEPFDVRYWCVGNEMWGTWQLGYMSLNHYVLKHNWVESMMREVDPDIITVGSGNIPGGWSEGLLRGSADHMDLIAEHFYAQSRDDLTAHVRQVPNFIRSRSDAHRQLREEMPQLEGKDIRIAMTEWNYWYGPHVFGELGTRYFMRDALGIAAGLHEYFRQSDIIHSAYYAQTVNVIGAIKTTKTAVEFDATAYPLILYRREFGTRPLEVDGTSDELDIAAALCDDGIWLTIGVVNSTWNTYEVSLDLNGLRPDGHAAGWTIHHENPMAHNHPGEEPLIGIESLPETDLNEPVTVQPVSINLYKVRLR